MSNGKRSTLLTTLAALALQGPSPVAAQGDDPACTLPIECPETGRSFDENSGVLSPPIVLEPLYACASFVRIAGFVPGAKIEVSLNGDVKADIVCEDPDQGCAIQLDEPLEVGDVVQARQHLESDPGTFSAPSTATARDHTLDYPGDLPTPEVDAPLYVCGEAVGATHLVPGATVTFTREREGHAPETVASRETTNYRLVVLTDPHEEGFQFRAQQSLCSSSSQPSAPEAVIPAPTEPLPPPRLVGTAIEGEDVRLTYTEAAFGARISYFINGLGVTQSTHTSAYGAHVRRGLWGVDIEAGDELTMTQQLCGDPSDPSEPLVVMTCDELPPPQMQPPQVGDTHIELDVRAPGARIRVYADGVEVGDGGGPVIRLTRPLELGETIAVVQDVGSCTSLQAHTLPVACKAIRRVRALDGWGHYGVGGGDYELPVPVNLGPVESRVRGTIRYPVDPLGGDQVVPYGRPLPVFIFMHGNLPNNIPPGSEYGFVCSPGGNSALPELEEMGYTRIDDHHLGFVPLLEEMAREGFIAVSIDAWDINCHELPGFQELLLQEGAQLFVEHLDYLEALNDGSATTDPFDGSLEGRVDLSRTVIAGHSRGARRLPYVVDASNDPDVAFSAMIMVAPPIPTPFEGGSVYSASGVPLLVVRGSRDSEEPSFQYYDVADSSMRSMLYVHGATHNGFSSMWEIYAEARQDAFPSFGYFLGAELQGSMLREWTRRWARLHVVGPTPDERSVFTGDGRVRGLTSMFGDEWVTHSFSEDSDLLIDDFNNGDIEKGPMETPVAVTGFDVVEELPLAGSSSPDPRLSYHEDGLYLESSTANGSIEHDTSSWDPGPLDVSGFRYLSLRAASLGSSGSARLAVNINGGGSSAVSTDGLVRIPAPYDHHPYAWAILGTVRVPLACIEATNPEADRSDVQSIYIENSGLETLAIDDLAFQN